MATVDGALIPNDCSAYEGAPACLSQDEIDAANAVPSSFDITVDAAVSNGILNVTSNVNCTQDASGNLKLFVVLIEKVIDWGTAPGSNGEVVFYNVMKKFLPNVSGIDISNSWNAGENNTYEESLNTGDVNIYNMGELAVVVFIQDMDTKEVFQAGVAMNVDIAVDYNNSVAAIDLIDLPESVCAGEQTYAPTVVIQNMGNNNLTSCVITYNINGGDDMVYNFSGDIPTLGNANVELDPYTFIGVEENTINAVVSMPNGVDDDDSNPSNSVNAGISLAPIALLNLTLVLNTDCWPDENTWNIKNAEGEVVASGGPYDGQVETEITETITLPADDCYGFTFMDVYGDGLHGSQWTDCSTDGNLNVFDEQGNDVFSYDGSYDISSETRVFEGVSILSIKEILNVVDFNIYPNPTSNVAHISMNLLETNNVRVEVVDLLGKIVYAENMGQVAAGNQLFEVDASSISNGMYMFNIYVGEQKVTKRVSISK
jgi:hypothetical protein